LGAVLDFAREKEAFGAGKVQRLYALTVPSRAAVVAAGSI